MEFSGTSIASLIDILKISFSFLFFRTCVFFILFFFQYFNSTVMNVL